MKREDTRELRFKDGENEVTAALKIQRRQSAATKNDHSRLDVRYYTAYISQPDYLGKTSLAHAEFFFVVGGLTLRLYMFD
jgi:hypothetical protein